MHKKCKLIHITNEQEQIAFVSAHVYYWHESPNSITRANDCQYSYGSSNRDSFYGYVENMTSIDGEILPYTFDNHSGIDMSLSEIMTPCAAKIGLIAYDTSQDRVIFRRNIVRNSKYSAV